MIKNEPDSKITGIKESLSDIIKSKIHANNDLLVEKTEEFIKNSIRKDALMIGAEGIGEHDEAKIQESYVLMEQASKITLDEDFGLGLENVDEMLDYLNEDFNGLLTNIPSIDKMLGKGIYSRSLTVYLAPPGIGKTAAMISTLCQFLKQGEDCVFFSLEMSEPEVMKRIYANIFDIDIHSLDNVDREVIKMKYKELTDSGAFGKLVIKEYPSYEISALNIQGFLEKYEQKTGISHPIVFVDYLGLMNSSRLRAGTTNSYEYIKSITAELRAVSQKRDLKIFSAAQLNRNAVGNLEAGQETVADSAGISAFSDCMIFLLQTKEMKELGKILLNFEKNRYSGKTYSIEIGFDYSKMKFMDLTQPEIVKDEHGLNMSQSPFKL
jgi:replicative DNA helicase